MRLAAVKFNRFRCLYDTDWLPLRNLTAFIGENDSGKSAALDGTAMLLGAAALGTTDDISFKSLPAAGGDPDVPREHEADFIVWGRFELTEDERLAWTQPLDTSGDAIVSLAFSTNGRVWSVTGKVSADPDLRIDPPSTNLNDLRALLVAKGGVSPGGNTKAPYVDAMRQLIANCPKTTASITVATPPHLTSCEVLDFRRAQSADLVLNTTLKALFAEFITANMHGELATIEQRAKKVLQAKADELGRFVKRYRSDVGSVLVKPEVDFASGYKRAAIDLTDSRGNPIPLRLRGQGLHAHLRLAAFEWSGELLKRGGIKHRIALFDEPDTHLDYQSQRRILGVLEEYAEDGQVIVATHSMSLINRVMLEQIAHFTLDKATGRSEPRIASTVPGTETTEINRIGTSLGIENATLFYERAFFVYEGETEERAIPRMYDLWTRGRWYLDGIRFVNGTNNQGAILFARFLHNNRRPVIAFVDEDTTWKKSAFNRQFTKARLEGQALLPANQIKTIGPKCFELAFSDGVWSRAVSRATGGKKRLRKAKLAALRATPEAFLKHLVTASGRSKPELGAALANVIRRNEIPAELSSAIDAIRTLAQN